MGQVEKPIKHLMTVPKQCCGEDIELVDTDRDDEGNYTDSYVCNVCDKYFFLVYDTDNNTLDCWSERDE